MKVNLDISAWKLSVSPKENVSLSPNTINGSAPDRQSLEPAWASEAGLKLLIESAPMAIVTVDRAGRIMYVNAKLLEVFGYERHELIGQPVETLIPARFHHSHVKHRQSYGTDPHNRAMGIGFDLAACRKDGTEFPIEVGLSHIQINGEMVIVCSINDVSVRKQAEEILEHRVEIRTREIERRRQVADGLRDILTILNSNLPPGEILNYVVAQASRLLDADASAIYRLHPENQTLSIQTSYGLPSEYIAKQGAVIGGKGRTIQAALTRRPVAIPDLSIIIDEGDETSRFRRETLMDSGYGALLAVPLTVKDEVYGSLVLYYHKPCDFSAEEINLAVTFADQAALAIENARLQSQVEQAAILAERNRLARELHDSVTQTLFSASLIAEVLPKLWERRVDEGRRRSEELRQLTRGALAEMRTLLLELRPSRLTEVSLHELLRQLAEAVNGRARVPVTLELGQEMSLLPDVQIAFYRTAQEALNNVAKHAQASQVEINLDTKLSKVVLRIRDNGRGFDFDSIRPNSLGLTIMRERAEAIAADLSVRTQIGQGTEVLLSWTPKKIKNEEDV
jgi:PAS domain S-box-containing protein